jgi:hypothetical protein
LPAVTELQTFIRTELALLKASTRAHNTGDGVRFLDSH